jgi:CheY-like chemotaxis protein
MSMHVPLEILLVEDNEGDVVMTKHALGAREPACNISVVDDGVKALDLLSKRGAYANAPSPRLILLDLNMPRMDGKKFLEVVKQDPSLKAIPVVMLTSSESPADIRDCYERHANCYVVKPFDGRKFADVVRQVVSFWATVGHLP